MNAKTVYSAYLRSFLFVLLLVAILAICGVVSFLSVEFMHRSPGSDSVASAFGSALAVTISALLATGLAAILVFTFPQLLQAVLVRALIKPLGDRARFSALLALPLTAVLTWYCYDYLTIYINLGINDGEDWTPYQHGITFSRYTTSLLAQTPITLFSCCYLDARVRQWSRKRLVLVVLVLAIVAGSALGYCVAMSQYPSG